MTQTQTQTPRLPSRSEVDAAWAGWTPPTKWQARCLTYMRLIPFRGGKGGILSDEDQGFLVEASQQLGCRISEVVSRLLASSDPIETRTGKLIVAWDIYS